MSLFEFSDGSTEELVFSVQDTGVPTPNFLVNVPQNVIYTTAPPPTAYISLNAGTGEFTVLISGKYRINYVINMSSATSGGTDFSWIISPILNGSLIDGASAYPTRNYFDNTNVQRFRHYNSFVFEMDASDVFNLEGFINGLGAFPAFGITPVDLSFTGLPRYASLIPSTFVEFYLEA